MIKIFTLSEEDKYKTIEDLYVFIKLCEQMELGFSFLFSKIVKLLGTTIPTNDYAIRIKVSGSEESIDKLKKVWESMKNDKSVKEELDTLLFHQCREHQSHLKNMNIL